MQANERANIDSVVRAMLCRTISGNRRPDMLGDSLDRGSNNAKTNEIQSHAKES